jgi:hypothetical protein
MSRCKESMDLDGVDDALGKLFAAQLALGKEAFKLLGTGFRNACSTVRCMELPKGSSCCDKPEPCWMPKQAAEICCELAVDDKGEICILVSNDDFRNHTYDITAAGEHGGLVNLSATHFELGPKERRMVSATFKLPKRDDNPDKNSCCQLNDYEVVLWVKGCQQHYISWYINAAAKTKDCCHEVCVSDSGYYDLNWYDHFHVLRPCVTGN